ncbi:MAG: hypothetical protein GY696_06400, partial [Gammaproteobacteria bacterium]|nr:hypothetical protein [Gammaproteobacteria bacterium]
MSISTESVESSRGHSRKSSNLLSDLEEVIQDGASSSGHQCDDSSDGRNSYAGSHHHGTAGKGRSSHHQQHGSTGEGRGGSYETGFLRRGGGATEDDRNNSFAMAGHHHGERGVAGNDPNNSNNRCPYLNADADDSVNHNLTTTTTSDDLGLSDSDSLGSSYDNLGSDDKGRYE